MTVLIKSNYTIFFNEFGGFTPTEFLDIRWTTVLFYLSEKCVVTTRVITEVVIRQTIQRPYEKVHRDKQLSTTYYTEN